MSSWLDGRRALVVGAGSGIGRAVVDRFLEQGARVGVLERDPGKARALREAFPEMPVTVGDASEAAPNDAAVAACVAAFGGLDVVVSCVGIFDYYRSLEDLDAGEIDAAFDEIFTVNVRSCLHMVKAALPALHASPTPRGDSPGRAEDLASRVALHVALDGSDHASSYVFLASEHARGMTGESLHSDGGMGVSGAPRKRS